MSKEKIIFDVDGVLLNYLENFTNYMKDVHGIHHSGGDNFTNCFYNFSDVFPEINGDIGKFIKEFSIHDSFSKITPLIGSQDGIKLISKKYHINAITSAGNSELTKSLRLKNLKLFFDWQDDWNIYFTKLGESKIDFLSKYKDGTFFIDDLILNIIDAKKCNLNTIWFKESERHLLKDDFELNHLKKHPIVYGWENLLKELNI